MEPVELYNPKSGNYYTARTPVELNDLVNAGYRRAESVEASERVEHVEDDHVAVDRVGGDHVEVEESAGAEAPYRFEY